MPRRRHLYVASVLAGAVSILQPVTPAAAAGSAVVMSPACADGIGNGTQLKQAVDLASANGVDDTILLASGCTYSIPSTLVVGPDIGGTTGLPHALEIRSSGVGMASIDAQLKYRAFHVQHKTSLTLRRIRVARGAAVGPQLSATEGGGLVNFGNLHLVRSTFRDNYAENAGGALRNHGTMSLLKTRLVDNESRGRGGAIDNNGVLSMHRSTITGNVAHRLDGGAINNFLNGDMKITDSSLVGNVAGVRGGGLFNSAELDVAGSTIADNEAASGGGMHNEQDHAAWSADVELEASLVEGNGASDSGGGIANVGSESSATVTGSSLERNHAANDGGGVFNSGGLELMGTAIARNTASGDGGGLFSVSEATVTGSFVTYNVATRGGAVYAAQGDGANVEISRSTLVRNSGDFGGGIFGAAEVLLEQSTLSANRALRDGGGVAVYGSGSLTGVNSTLSGNRALRGRGGAIFAELGSDDAEVEVTSSTVVRNRAEMGGGIYRVGSAGAVHFWNTIVALNDAVHVTMKDCTGSLDAGARNLSGTMSCGAAAGFAVVDLAVTLGPLADNGGPTQTHALLPGSPAIGTGVGCPPTDQRGVARDVCDIGAYEA